MDTEAEEYLLLLLADSNLPTGSFVASSGLESYLKHGFGALSASSADATLNFVCCSLESFARSTLAFVTGAHEALVSASGENIQDTLIRLRELDELYHCMTLNNVTRRASQSQGVALLTLYSKGFARAGSEDTKVQFHKDLVDEFKLSIRRGDTPGHLPICWGTLTGALGLSLSTTVLFST
jgi:urease accessory protein